MISVNGGMIVLDGADVTLQKELAYLFGMLHSRVLSQGRRDQYFDEMIGRAALEERERTLDYLRSEARMIAGKDSVGKR